MKFIKQFDDIEIISIHTESQATEETPLFEGHVIDLPFWIADLPLSKKYPVWIKQNMGKPFCGKAGLMICVEDEEF